MYTAAATITSWTSDTQPRNTVTHAAKTTTKPVMMTASTARRHACLSGELATHCAGGAPAPAGWRWRRPPSTSSLCDNTNQNNRVKWPPERSSSAGSAAAQGRAGLATPSRGGSRYSVQPRRRAALNYRRCGVAEVREWENL